ncbi:MAG: S-layer homology domain-containing protein [Clostridia bacterium]|nr:S-layer homology domain-containing protein [Clostridia bacterium]
MKKTVSILTLICIIFSLCVPSFASEVDNDYARVLEMVKKRIPPTDSFDEFDSSSYKRDGKTSYSFSWYNSDDNEDFKSMQLNVSESGFITSYHCNDSSKETYSSKPSFKNTDIGKAMEKCAILIEKLNPALKDNFTLEPSSTSDLNSRVHRFSIQRTKNGIPVYGDTGYVTTDENADAILSFNLKYSEGIDFPEVQNIISKEDAQKAFFEKIGMTLLYEISYTKDDNAPFAAYRVEASNEFINANSGDILTPISPEHDMYLNKNESISMDSAAGASKPGFSEAELKELENISGLMDENAACAVIKSNKVLSVDSKASLTRSSLYSDGKDKFFYNMAFEVDDSEYINVTFDAKSGEIKSFNRSYSNHSDFEDKTADAAKAKENVASLAPDYYNEQDTGKYRFEKSDLNRFTFVRYENDIPFFNDTISIAVSPIDGAVLSYYISFTDVVFSLPETIYSEKDACTKLFEQVDYDLVYYPVCSKEEMSFCDTAFLVYMLDESKNPLIEADTGKLVYDYEAETVGNYTDISGHWAEGIINELAKYSIGFSEEKFRPDEVINQKDFIALLSNISARHYPGIIGKNYDYDSVYNDAEREGIISNDEKAPEEAVTREKAAIYMIRAIDLEQVAKLDGIYLSLYGDVTENTGYIAILTGLKIVSGYNGFFNPQREITRAEAMVMIYNYLAN